MEFHEFTTEVQRQFNRMKDHEVFRVAIDKDSLWDTYLKSFPEGTNIVYKERAEYDCSNCKNFIRNAGDMVAIIDGKLESIWDINIGGYFQVVSDALSEFVKSAPIDNQFIHIEGKIGMDKTYQLLENGETLTWHHFYAKLPKKLFTTKDSIGTKLAEFRTTKDMLFRSLNEITVDSLDNVLELIAQNSLYRGEEHQFVLDTFRKLKVDFMKCSTEKDKDLFCWNIVNSTPQSISRIRNTVIGTLLVDLSEGKDLQSAVGSFESKVAPTNYKRPTAVISKAMIDNAKEKIEELGLTSALERRFATLEDISINNILFADREAKKRIDNIFDELSTKVPDKVKNLDKVEEVTIEQFINNILPKAESIEVMFDNKHTNNLVSLIAPVDLTAGNLFKWDNNFSWSYTGDLTDSIKERVKQQGGRVEADLRCSLSWFNYDDLDLHIKEPSGYEIYFSNRSQTSPSGGTLDVDMNAGSGSSRSAVENIVYPHKYTMKEGTYKLEVNNYNQRETIDVGFDVEVEFDGVINTFHYPKTVKNKETITVAEIQYSKNEGIKIINSIPSSQATKQLWNLSTQTFHKVAVIMNSPNHWDDKPVGNKHYFFMIDGCINDGQARGFYNEFLKEELNTHRKVLEIVGSKMKTQETANQLSGLGFSSTQRNTLLCRVKGSFSRIIKIVF